MQGPEPVRGVVPLKDKTVPTEDLASECQPTECCFSYGSVDITAFVDRMVAQPVEFWDDEVQGKENVKIARPFHDNLGVKKVIFLFSDTAARPQVFQLPLWDGWKDLLVPIFNQCGLQERQVVRCLLARMPPGGVIPPHHDNGKWVSQTHRVHIAVVTNKDLHFTAGPTVETMRRYAFNPGTAVELNNSAKHSVENRGDKSRVHMILDWVDPETVPSLPQPQKLMPGQHVRQVRGRVEIVESAEEVRNPLATKANRDKYARQRTLAGQIAAQLAGEAAKEGLLIGRSAALRKWHIQHYDATEFWAAVLDLVSHGCKNPDEGLVPVEPEEREQLIDALATAFEAMAEATDDVMAADFRRAVTEQKSRSTKEEIARKRVREDEPAAPSTISRVVASEEELLAVAAVADQSRWPRAPRFIILGAQKCGTTTLWDHLAQHPCAVRAAKREPHFFDWNWRLCNPASQAIPEPMLEATRTCLRDIEPLPERDEETAFEVPGTTEIVGMSQSEVRARYLALFRAPLDELAANPRMIVGESTPSYLFYGTPVLQRIKAVLPQVRLLVILRNPTERAYSHYSMTAEKGANTPKILAERRKVVEGKSFEELIDHDLALLAKAGVVEASIPEEGAATLGTTAVVDAERLQSDYLDQMPHGHGSHGYVGRGLYAAQLEILYRVFPKSQVLVLSLEQLKPELVANTMASVYSFVGLPSFDIVGVGDATPKNTRDYKPMPDEARERLRKFYAPHNARLYEMIGRDLGWD